MNLIHKWNPIVAVSCNHGHLQDDARIAEVLQFAKDFGATTRVLLGDVVDTAAFRRGAEGTADEGVDPEPDTLKGIEFIHNFRPTHITWGNHDWRLWQLSTHPKAIVAQAAKFLRKQLEDAAKDVGAICYPYTHRKNVALIGGVHYMHGFAYGADAIAKHSSYVKGRVVFGHTHRNGIYCPNGMVDASSFNVGTLADVDKMHYAHQRLATGSWGPGAVWGYHNETKSHLWLSHSDQGEPLVFPGVLDGH